MKQKASDYVHWLTYVYLRMLFGNKDWTFDLFDILSDRFCFLSFALSFSSLARISLPLSYLFKAFSFRLQNTMGAPSVRLIGAVDRRHNAMQSLCINDYRPD